MARMSSHPSPFFSRREIVPLVPLRSIGFIFIFSPANLSLPSFAFSFGLLSYRRDADRSNDGESVWSFIGRRKTHRCTVHTLYTVYIYISSDGFSSWFRANQKLVLKWRGRKQAAATLLLDAKWKFAIHASPVWQRISIPSTAARPRRSITQNQNRGWTVDG